MTTEFKKVKKTIYKYTLEVKDSQELCLPIGAEILCVQTQNEKPCIWALVDEGVKSETRIIEIFGTGEEIEFDASAESNEKIYIGTFQLLTGNFVGHVFEKLS